MSVAIVLNPIAGGATPAVARARAIAALRVLDLQGNPASVFVTERRDHARELTRAALAHGARRVLAWGGDGTINEVASVLAFGDVPLGIIPAGSGNGLARELGVSLRSERAAAEAIAAVPRAIDVGEINGRLFVNVAGIGIDAHVASQFNAIDARRRGALGYVGITLRALATYVPGTYRITAEGATSEHRAILITIANSAQFGNGARIAPGACVDDGALDLVVIQERSRAVTLGHMHRLFNGTVARMPGCRLQRIREVSIEADRPMIFHVDGEPVEGGTRIEARVHPGALRIAVR